MQKVSADRNASGERTKDTAFMNIKTIAMGTSNCYRKDEISSKFFISYIFDWIFFGLEFNLEGEIGL